MANSWPLIRLGDFVEIQTGLPFKSNFFSDSDGIKLLRGDNIVQGGFRWANVKRWPEDLTGNKEKAYLLDEGDVILAMDRPWIEAGLKTGQINKSDLPCLLVQRVARLRAKNIEDQDFLRYLVSSHSFVQYVKLVQTGTAVPHISTKQIKGFEFRLPPKNVRVRIGKIIKSLDKKNHLNQQTNQTLEQMAQALFKSWFVDFDPVVDNALAAGSPIPAELAHRVEARKKAHALHDFQPFPEHIRNLFPSEFEQTDQPTVGIGGWVPKGWKIKKMLDVANVTTGKRPPQKVETSDDENKIPVWGGNGVKWFTNDILEKDDYIITGRVGTLGTVYKVSGSSWPSDNALVIKPHEHFLFDFVFQVLQRADLLNLNAGSTQPMITQTSLKQLTVLLPEQIASVEVYQKIAQSYSVKIAANRKVNETLVKVRGHLLPKLISGEIQLDSTAKNKSTQEAELQGV